MVNDQQIKDTMMGLTEIYGTLYTDLFDLWKNKTVFGKHYKQSPDDQYLQYGRNWVVGQVEKMAKLMKEEYGE